MNRTYPIKVVSFDFGGVFVRRGTRHHYEKSFFHRVQRVVPNHCTRREIDNLFRRFLAFDHKESARHRSGDIASFFAPYFANKGIDATHAASLILDTFSDPQTISPMRVNPQIAKHTLRFLRARGIRIALVSDTAFPSLARRIHLEKWGLLHYFDLVLTSQEEGIKRGLSIFKKMIHFFHVPPHSVLHVGDMLADDIAPAKKLGMATCLFASRGHAPKRFLKEHQPDFVARNFFDIENIILHKKKYIKRARTIYKSGP